MERYQILEEWRSGIFGELCVAADRKDNIKYAVKKVECMDEREANLALKEATKLLSLKHPNICGYKEFFITWDNKISSLFLCLVMDYSYHRDLAGIVQLNRQQKQNTDEKMIQILLGQTLDVLVYLHKQKIIHRNLKPRNIFFKDEKTFLFGDFLLETLVKDEMRMKKRVEPREKLWMAPEIDHCTNSDKSDIWSLGCILLDVMTCTVYSANEISSILEDIRKDPRSLEKLVRALQDTTGYSDSLCQLLPPMLQIDPKKRPSAVELVEMPYGKKCLALTGSPLSGVKKKLSGDIMNELEEGGIEETLEFMKIHKDFENAQIAAIRKLFVNSANPDGLLQIEEAFPLVVQAMRLHCDSMDVQLDGCRILQDVIAHALEYDPENKCLANADLVLALVGAIRSHPNSKELLSLAFRVVTVLSTNDVAVEMLVKAGFLEDMVKTMDRSLQDQELCTYCCRLLWSIAMTVTEGSVQRVWLELAVPLIFTLLKEYPQDGHLVESACCALWILSLRGCVVQTEIEGVSQALLQSLQSHPKRPVLVKNAILALASLIRTSELALYRILLPPSGKSGISIIKETYQRHPDDPEIVENICLLFYEMSQYGSTRHELLSQHVDQFMGEINVKFESTEEIVTLAQSTLLKLETRY